MMHPDDEGFSYTSPAEWDRAGAVQNGAENPERAWILSDRDVWYANPYYRGPAMPHPEDHDGEDAVQPDDAWRRDVDVDMDMPF